MKGTSVQHIENCYGCGVCAIVCAKRAIQIELNDDGFYTPIVDSAICNKCGVCVSVCSYSYTDVALESQIKNGYGAWSNDSNVRRRCSSGGVGYELGRRLLNEGYKVCAVKYDPVKQRAEHYIASNEDELMLSVGSKYIQSYTVDAFRAINKNAKYLITGTPCQIDSFRRYLRKFKVEDNFVLMDFFCHSVPSMLAWQKYLKIVEETTGPVTYASWRNKNTGWHDSWAIAIDGLSNIEQDSYNINIPERNHQYNSLWSKGDLFYTLFLGDYCSNPACVQRCKYKYDKSSADIRIGDFWGETYQLDDKGVSAVVAFTQRGDDLIKELNCTIIEHPFEVVAEGQMKRNALNASVSPLVRKKLKDPLTTEDSLRLMFKIEKLIKLPKRIINKVIRGVWKRK